MFCKYCGKELADTAKFCSRCGKQIIVKLKVKPVTEKKKFCENCGEPLVDGAKFCLACGTSVFASKSPAPTPATQNQVQDTNRISQFGTTSNPAQYKPTESQKSRLAATLLCFFLGGIGAHRFYVGKTATAVAQIVGGLSFFLDVIPLLLGVIYDLYELMALFVIFSIFSVVCFFWVLVDFIMILSGAFKDKNNLPLVKWDL